MTGAPFTLRDLSKDPVVVLVDIFPSNLVPLNHFPFPASYRLLFHAGRTPTGASASDRQPGLSLYAHAPLVPFPSVLCNPGAVVDGEAVF